eukprot:6359192-Alexandrium_andersonii.AAC.1
MDLTANVTAGHHTSKCSALNSPQPQSAQGSTADDAGLPPQMVAGPAHCGGAEAASPTSSMPAAAATQAAP